MLNWCFDLRWNCCDRLEMNFGIFLGSRSLFLPAAVFGKCRSNIAKTQKMCLFEVTI